MLLLGSAAVLGASRKQGTPALAAAAATCAAVLYWLGYT